MVGALGRSRFRWNCARESYAFRRRASLVYDSLASERSGGPKLRLIDFGGRGRTLEKIAYVAANLTENRGYHERDTHRKQQKKRTNPCDQPHPRAHLELFGTRFISPPYPGGPQDAS